MDKLSQMPGEDLIPDISPQDVVLSFSETKTEASKRAGKQAAGQRLYYWRILRRSRQPGGKADYNEDKELQALLCRENGNDRPQYVPCVVFGNPVADPSREDKLTLPDSIVFRELAMFQGAKPICRCNQATELNRVAQFAILEPGKDSRGNALKTPEGKPIMKKVGEKSRECLGAKCPDRIAAKCKPHIVVNLYLPWARGICAKFRCASVVTFGSMRSSLLDIAGMTGGVLHGVPLEMVWDEIWVDNPGAWVPQIRFRPHVQDASRLLEEGNRLLQLQSSSANAAAQVKRLQEQSRTAIVKFMDDPAEQKAFAQEYHPNQQQGAPVIIEGQYEVETPEAETPAPATEPEPAPAAPAAPTSTFTLPEAMEGKLLDLMNVLEMSDTDQAAAFGKLTSLADANALLKDLMLRVKTK